MAPDSYFIGGTIRFIFLLLHLLIFALTAHPNMFSRHYSPVIIASWFYKFLYKDAENDDLSIALSQVCATFVQFVKVLADHSRNITGVLRPELWCENNILILLEKITATMDSNRMSE